MSPMDITDIASKLDSSKPENLIMLFIAEKVVSLSTDVQSVNEALGEVKICTENQESRLKKLEQKKGMCDNPNGCSAVMRVQKMVYWLFGILFTVQTGTTIALFTTVAKILATPN